MNVWAVEHFFSSELDRGLSANLILMKKMFNCSEAHSERSNFLQNPYFKYQRKKVALTFSKKIPILYFLSRFYHMIDG